MYTTVFNWKQNESIKRKARTEYSQIDKIGLHWHPVESEAF